MAWLPIDGLVLSPCQNKSTRFDNCEFWARAEWLRIWGNGTATGCGETVCP